MRLHRFIGDFDFERPVFDITDSEAVHQIQTVLRLKEGDEILLGDGNMHEARGVVRVCAPKQVTVGIVEQWENTAEPQVSVTLYSAVLKKENFELVTQKATEVGVREIVPVLTQRTVKHGIRRDRILAIIKEAAEQSGRGVVPVLHEIMDFSTAIQNAQRHSRNIFFDASGDISFPKLDAKDVGVFVGPEGGWGADEIETAKKQKGFSLVSLGPRVLRAETAAIAGSFFVVNSFHL